MKTPLLPRFTPRSLSAVAIGSMLCLSAGAWAAPANPRVIGTESVHQEASLTSPTAVAGLGGEVTLVAMDKLYNVPNVITSHGHIEVDPEGLAEGTYTVSASMLSGSNQVLLGTLTIPVPVTSSTSTVVEDPGDVDTSAVEFGGDGTPLPAGIDLLDVGGVLVSDSNNNVVLSADLTSAGISKTFHVESAIVAGPAAPAAKGHLSILSKVRANSKGLNLFALAAKGLPKNITATLAIDGQDVATIQTGRRGAMAILRHVGKAHPKGKRYINELPPTVDLQSIQTISVHDATAAELFHINL
ncbi:MAG: hypothetical protein WCP06_09040 [Verrucomicrobiota bacterium]